MASKILVTLLLFSLCCILGVNSKIDEKFKKDFYRIYKNIAIDSQDLTNQHVSPDQVKYYLFTKTSKSYYTEIDPKNLEELVNHEATYVFLIHGWLESREKQWYEDLKDAFLSRPENYYIVQVDWHEPAKQTYTISSWNTKEVGYMIGDMIVNMHQNYSVPFENIILVGHSLGGQIAGFIGKRVQKTTGEKLPRIVALDPAGPYFNARPEEKRLNKNDAEVVQAIHTDAGTFGFEGSCGTIDFYPNGGYNQPGCARVDLFDITSVAEPVICDHQRSWKLYIEAIFNPNALVGTKCNSWVRYEANLCSQVHVAMGDLTTHETGDFYLATNQDSPFNRKQSSSLLGNMIGRLKPLKYL